LLLTLIFAFPGMASAGIGDPCGEIPVDLVLSLDRTGSVEPEKRADEAAAAKELAQLVIGIPGSRVAIVRFGGDGNLENNAELVQPLSSDLMLVTNQIDQALATKSDGWTNLVDTLDVSMNELLNVVDPNEKRVIVLL